MPPTSTTSWSRRTRRSRATTAPSARSSTTSTSWRPSPERSSSLRQRELRIDPRRAARGQGACRQRNESEQDGGGRRDQRVGRANAEELALDAAVECESADAAQHYPGGEQLHALPQDEPEDAAGAAAQGESDADLPGSLRHEVGEDAIDPHR